MFSNHFPPLPQPEASKPADNHSTIVVSKLPPSIRDPTSRKDFIDQLSGHDSVASIRPVGDKLFVNIEKIGKIGSVPRCCFKCRSPDHFINDCTSQVEKMCALRRKSHFFERCALYK